MKFDVFLLDYDEKNANVLCRMGGYKGGVYHGGRYKQRYAFCNKYLIMSSGWITTGISSKLSKSENFDLSWDFLSL